MNRVLNAYETYFFFGTHIIQILLLSGIFSPSDLQHDARKNLKLQYPQNLFVII